MATKFLTIILFILASQQALCDLQLTVNPNNLSDVELGRVKFQLNVISKLLPKSLLTRLNKNMSINFEKMPDKQHGYQSKNNITLNINLIKNLVSDPQLSSLFNRTVLHELAHSYDENFVQEVSDKVKSTECTGEGASAQNECLFYSQYNTTISTEPQYLMLAGWLPSGHSKSLLKEKNYYLYRSPDLYELTNPKEHAAVNFEYFMTDDNYKCRRPTLFAYFKKHFNHDPFPEKNCDTNLVFSMDNVLDNTAGLKKINLDRIYKIDYLWAEGTSNIMSKWGHAMLRLVICAPDKPLNDNCYRDESHHIVISFRAFINSAEMSQFDGLTGKYDSRLFFIPFRNIVDEYNSVELRNLHSYTLNLSAEQIKTLVEKSIEMHWQYASKYYFLTNNCATEVFNLLRVATNNKKLYFYNPLTPVDLIHIFEKESIFNLNYTKILKSKNEALKFGLFHQSHAEPISNSIKKLQKIEISFEAYKKMKFSERMNAINFDSDYVAAAYLERQVYKYKRSEFYKLTLQSLLKSTDQDFIEKLNLTMKKSEVLSAPYQLSLSGNYGIPNNEEQNNLSQDIVKTRESLNLLYNDHEEKLKNHFNQEQILELKLTYDFINETYKKIIELRKQNNK